MQGRNNNVLVLDSDTSDRMVFRFRSQVWAFAGLLLALIVFTCTSAFHEYSRFSPALQIIGYTFSGLFVYSAVYSVFARRTLEVDTKAGTVTYNRSSLFGTAFSTKPFGDFKAVTISRPGRASFLTVCLTADDHQEIPVGKSELGFLGVRKARELAERLHALMRVPLVEEPAVTRQL